MAFAIVFQCMKHALTLQRKSLCWLRGTSVRKTRRFLRTDVPRSQHILSLRMQLLSSATGSDLDNVAATTCKSAGNQW